MAINQVAVSGCLIVVALVLGAACGQQRTELQEVVDVLQADFIGVASVSTDQLEQASIQGIIEYLDDPYTSYMSPERFQAFSAALEGQTADFEGVGASVTEQDGRVVVLGPLPGSPAQLAGLLPGDVLLAVDGSEILGLTIDEAVALIRGPKGTEVILTVSRTGVSLPVEIAITRAKISVSSVLARLQGDGLGYIRLTGFDAGTAGKFRSAIADLRETGAQGLIIDLRNNGGGLVDAAVAVVSEFMDAGEVVRWEDGKGEVAIETVSGDGTAYDMPIIVLVNGFSASASEIVMGALQDHERATVIGTRTYGKGSVNTLQQLKSGAGLYVTISRWVTPNGRSIEGDGLTPDIQVGHPVDVRALGALGDKARDLCDAFGRDRAALIGQEQLVDALDKLCSIESKSAATTVPDVVLNAGVRELERLLGR